MKNTDTFSKIERVFLENSDIKEMTTKLPYIVVENFPKLGLITSLRFLEWVSENPEGVISLPTGKTPEYFIKYTQFLLENWNNKKAGNILDTYGLSGVKKPDLRGLHFVQIDEFYPIPSQQHNSFCNYVQNFYIKNFGLDPENALLIDCEKIPLVENKHFREVFEDYKVDLSLRFREPKNNLEKLRKDSIFMIDDWCSEYEGKVREKGGIGFFLGGIGPDGHIAFNPKGSDLYSTTRLTHTNFETQAVAATDLGGIEISRNRPVITIGLETITYNPDAVAIIIAAGESKGEIVKKSLENKPVTLYPATSLQRLKNSRFYLTEGAASRLDDRITHYYKTGTWTQEKTEKAVIDLCCKLDKYGHHITLEDLKADPFCSLIPDLSEKTVPMVIDSVKEKISKGIQKDENQSIYHTGPHHDDIMLGIMPYVNRQLRSISNTFNFSILTSGFTAVTNDFVIELLKKTVGLINSGYVQMLEYPDFFEKGYLKKWDKDIHHYLDNVAKKNEFEQIRGVCHRIVRIITEIWKLQSKEELIDTLYKGILELEACYDGEKNTPEFQKLKGMIREFEEELVWAHFGVPVKNVRHLRLGFYKGDIFTEQPEKERDVKPVLEELKKYKPGIISLALDPEGSGPDTHYKVLQVIAAAIAEWKKEEDLSNLRILGYRNVWYRFHPADADIIVPVSLNSLDILEKSFANCYRSQVNASFPSYEHDGKFSELTQKIWGEQLYQIQLLLGKNFFYENAHPLIRATHGLVYMKEFHADEFIDLAKKLEKVMEAPIF